MCAPLNIPQVSPTTTKKLKGQVGMSWCNFRFDLTFFIVYFFARCFFRRRFCLYRFLRFDIIFLNYKQSSGSLIEKTRVRESANSKIYLQVKKKNLKIIPHAYRCILNSCKFSLGYFNMRATYIR